MTPEQWNILRKINIEKYKQLIIPLVRESMKKTELAKYEPNMSDAEIFNHHWTMLESMGELDDEEEVECTECKDKLLIDGYRTYLLPCGYFCKACMEDKHQDCQQCFPECEHCGISLTEEEKELGHCKDCNEELTKTKPTCDHD